MSRIGFKIIEIPKEVEIVIEKKTILIKGPKGFLNVKINDGITCELCQNTLQIKRLNDKKETKMNHGTVRANINNAIIGVTNGFKKKLEIRGIGYKANMQNDQLCLNVGFSHPIFVKPTVNSKIICENANNIIIEGIDKCAVGQTAALIRGVKPPEPYNGKGIRYFGEVVLQKEGKRVAATTTTASAAKK